MDYVKRFKLNYSLLSAGYIVLGALRLFFPDPASYLMCYALGAIAALMGLVRVVTFFAKHDPSRVFHHDLAIGVTLLVVGVYIVARPQDIADILPVLLGFCVLFDSVIKMQYAFEMRRTDMKAWWTVLVVAMLTAIAGVLLILQVFQGSTLVYYLGVVLAADGIANLLTLFMMVIRLKQHDKQLAAAESGEALKPKKKSFFGKKDAEPASKADMAAPEAPEAPPPAPAAQAADDAASKAAEPPEENG